MVGSRIQYSIQRCIALTFWANTNFIMGDIVVGLEFALGYDRIGRKKWFVHMVLLFRSIFVSLGRKKERGDFFRRSLCFLYPSHLGWVLRKVDFFFF